MENDSSHQEKINNSSINHNSANMPSFISSDIGTKTAIKSDQFINIKKPSPIQRTFGNLKNNFTSYLSSFKHPATAKITYLKTAIYLLFFISIAAILAVSALSIKNILVPTAPEAASEPPLSFSDDLKEILDDMGNIKDQNDRPTLDNLLAKINKFAIRAEKKNLYPYANNLRLNSALHLAERNYFHDALTLIDLTDMNHLTLSQKHLIYKKAILWAEKTGNYNLKAKYQKTLNSLPPMPQRGGGG